MSLVICTDKHDELCYEGKFDCPGCKLLDDLREHEKENKRLEAVIVNLNSELDDLNNELARYETDFIQWSDVKHRLELPNDTVKSG